MAAAGFTSPRHSPLEKFPAGFDNQRPHRIGQQALHFAVESSTFPANAGEHVFRALAFNRYNVLQPLHAVIASRQRAGLDAQGRQVQRALLAGVANRDDAFGL